MRRRQITATAAASALAVTAIIGFSSAAGASEVNGQWTKLCVASAVDQCLLAKGASHAVAISPNNGSMTNWLYPDPGQIGEITQANTKLCMQIDADAGDVIQAACTGASYQEWSVKTYSDGDYDYESRWNTNDCLTYNQSGADLDVHGCTDVWYQSFLPPSGT